MSMMKIIYSTLVVMGMSFVAIPAQADNTHGVKVTVNNDAGKRVIIYTWNGKDSFHGSIASPHKVYYLDNGGTKKAKAHGDGSHHLWISVFVKATGDYCYNADGLEMTNVHYRNGEDIWVVECN